MKKYKDIGIYDFSDYEEEITGEDLIKINGGSSSCGGSTPVSEMKTSTKGIDFITSYEGYSSNIYDAENPNN